MSKKACRGRMEKRLYENTRNHRKRKHVTLNEPSLTSPEVEPRCCNIDAIGSRRLSQVRLPASESEYVC